LKLIKYVGKLDALNSIARLFTKHYSKDNKYCFVKYKKADSPHLKIKDCWHPYLVDSPIVNSIEMGGETNRSTLITGPNAAGKSTFIKTLIMNIYLSQTIGIAAARGMVITPFSLIDTYLHIPDCKGRDSLFEAEMYRSKKYINTIKNMKKSEFAFVVMDEMFSSTNYVEGYSAAYAILNKISSYNNSLSLVTTHYGKLAKLEEATKGRIKNYNFYINRDAENNIIYPYKIRKGVSNQYIALELLKLNDFDEDIIDVALAEAKAIKED
jgi:DNA mismatch repair protein MutS